MAENLPSLSILLLLTEELGCIFYLVVILTSQEKHRNENETFLTMSANNLFSDNTTL